MDHDKEKYILAYGHIRQTPLVYQKKRQTPLVYQKKKKNTFP